jgi:hypothetical protein
MTGKTTELEKDNWYRITGTEKMDENSRDRRVSTGKVDKIAHGKTARTITERRGQKIQDGWTG